MVKRLQASCSVVLMLSACGDSPRFAAPIRSAQALVTQATALAETWPGFWTDRQRFGVFPVDGRLLLITPGGDDSCDATPVPSARLPPPLRGRAFATDAPSDTLIPFDPAMPIGPCRVPSVRVVPPVSRYRRGGLPVGWFKDSVATQVMFIVHEAFHGFQAESFRVRPGSVEGPFANLTPLAAIRAQMESDSFHAVLAREREALLSAVTAESAEARWSAVRAYRDRRDARLAGMPSFVRDVEDNQERAEGVATWVGYEAVSRAVTGRAEDVRDVVIADLTSEWLDLEGRPYVGMQRYLRWHLYLVGTAKVLLLDLYGPPTWKQAIEAGTTLDVLLGTLVESTRPQRGD